jgi:hypothetical protein
MIPNQIVSRCLLMIEKPCNGMKEMFGVGDPYTVSSNRRTHILNNGSSSPGIDIQTG